MKRARPADDDFQESPQKKSATERSSSPFPLRLSGILFNGHATEHDLDENTPTGVGEYIATSPPSVDLPPRYVGWSSEHDAYVYRLSKPFTFRYHRCTIDHLDIYYESTEYSHIFWDHDGTGQLPKLFLHSAVASDPDDMDNTWPYEAWVLPDPAESDRDYERVRHYNPPFKLSIWCDDERRGYEGRVLMPTRASRYTKVEVAETLFDDRFYMPLDEPIPSGKTTHVIWDWKDLWAVRIGLSPVKPEKFVDYEYDVEATIDEVYVKEAFFDLPPKDVSDIEYEIEQYKRWLSEKEKDMSIDSDDDDLANQWRDPFIIDEALLW
ncbi:hypothetical protein CVT26_015081 [Gymnopilus dilepis]|uniref:Uncharacterized protein n=1 Tax=Gymnopilus dilepis TaxID=231916 RepID=A0A409YEM4_9AGAR|nr:hypothetical protein CVT26_015081 [Gymnopilus dilepis]